MKIIDISLPITEEIITDPGDVRFSKAPICTIERSGCNMTKLILGTHTATHIDAPFHFLKDGNSVDQIPLSHFIGKAQVIEVKSPEITGAIIEKELKDGIERVLFKTKNSELYKSKDFSKSYTHLTEDGAVFLVKAGIKLVGIDYVSIEKFGTPDFKVHKILFEANICVLEGIDLLSVNPGVYTLVALPLKFKGLDGSPVRAVLISERDLF